MSALGTRIMTELYASGAQTVEQIAQTFDVGPQTARKHLSMLACEGRVRRVKGKRTKRVGRVPFAYEVAP